LKIQNGSLLKNQNQAFQDTEVMTNLKQKERKYKKKNLEKKNKIQELSNKIINFENEKEEYRVSISYFNN
jgi:hypothetical protein